MLAQSMRAQAMIAETMLAQAMIAQTGRLVARGGARLLGQHGLK